VATAESLYMTIVVGLRAFELWWGALRILAIFIPSQEMVVVGKIKLSSGICAPRNEPDAERDRVEQYHQGYKCECMVGTG